MPIYEYECPECGAQQTLQRPIADRDKDVLCHGKMKRVISRGTGFLLKGGGWYKDGYGSQKPS